MEIRNEDKKYSRENRRYLAARNHHYHEGVERKHEAHMHILHWINLIALILLQDMSSEYIQHLRDTFVMKYS